MKNKIILALCLALNSTLSEAVVSCSISSPGLFFGAINPLTTAEVSSIGSINLNCTGGPVTYSISFSQGNGSMAQRVMKSGANILNYNLYTSSAYTSVLGDGTAGSLTINGSSVTDPTIVTYAVYGKIPNVGLSSTVAGDFL
jgi:spore coat protein U-like protein